MRLGSAGVSGSDATREREEAAMTGTFDDCGIRFEYPDDWEVEVTADGPITSVSLQAPDKRPAFALVTLDESCPAPADLADQALEAMREEYPGLDATPALETLGGHPAIGHDIEFISLDMTNNCAIRCFRTEQRTVLIFCQWSDLEGSETGDVLQAVRSSLEETDS
jgi:hypothetical protein